MIKNDAIRKQNVPIIKAPYSNQNVSEDKHSKSEKKASLLNNKEKWACDRATD